VAFGSSGRRHEDADVPAKPGDADALCGGARLCGRSGTAVTEQVYRHQIRPVIVEGALAMESVFSARGGEA
jgi:hypothetical protein